MKIAILMFITFFAIVLGALILFPRATLAAGRICGTASWYGTESGTRTATGERFTGRDMTAAMPSRAMLGKRVRVTLLSSGRSIVVRVNDLGPAARLHRVIDLSAAAAKRLGFGGIARVCIVEVT